MSQTACILVQAVHGGEMPRFASYLALPSLLALGCMAPSEPRSAEPQAQTPAGDLWSTEARGTPEARPVAPWTAGRDGRKYHFSGIFESGPSDCEERMAFDIESIRSLARRKLECSFVTERQPTATNWRAHCSGDVIDLGVATVESLTVSDMITGDEPTAETRDALLVSTRVVEAEESVQCVWRGSVSLAAAALEQEHRREPQEQAHADHVRGRGQEDARCGRRIGPRASQRERHERAC